MPDDAALTLAKVRLDKANECLQSAEREVAADSFKSAANRSYYCIFHSIRAVLALDKFDSKKHSGVISEFRLKYLKTGIFPIEFSNIIRDAFDIRNSSDYDDFFLISKDDVLTQISNAKILLKAVEDFIMEKEQFQTIPEYIAAQPEAARPILEKVYETIRAAAPDAAEKISWQMPTFWQGENLVHFALNKKHVGLYPGALSGVEVFADKLKGYTTTKGSIHFPLDKPIDYDFIAEITRYRVESAKKKKKEKETK